MDHRNTTTISKDFLASNHIHIGAELGGAAGARAPRGKYFSKKPKLFRMGRKWDLQNFKNFSEVQKKIGIIPTTFVLI